MDFSNHVLNFIFIVGIFVVFAIGVSALMRAVASGNTTLMVLAGALVFALVVGTALFWSDGYIRTTMSEKFMSLFNGSAPALSAAPVNNIRVEVPEQAPPTVVVQTPTTENSPSLAPDDASETTLSVEESAPDHRSEIFNLGSGIDGHFEDGTPYKIYKVESGDTIYNIRTRNGLSEAELLNRNPDLDIRRPIIIGREIKIPIN